MGCHFKGSSRRPGRIRAAPDGTYRNSLSDIAVFWAAMVNQALHDYLRQVNRRLQHLPRSVQREVVAELLAHIEDQASVRQKADPGLARAQAAAQAIEAFCPADDVGVAVGPRGGIIRSSTGELLIPVAVLSGRGLGRHARSTQAWTAVAAAGCTALVAVVAFAVFGALQDGSGWDDSELSSVEVWRLDLIRRDMTQASGNESAWMQVPPGASPFAIDVRSSGTGCLGLRLFDPPGFVVIDRWDGCEGIEEQVQSNSVGDWRLDVRMASFSGSLVVSASAV